MDKCSRESMSLKGQAKRDREISEIYVQERTQAQ